MVDGGAAGRSGVGSPLELLTGVGLSLDLLAGMGMLSLDTQFGTHPSNDHDRRNSTRALRVWLGFPLWVVGNTLTVRWGCVANAANGVSHTCRAKGAACDMVP